MPNVSGLDHVVLVCSDVARSVAWYRDMLGLVPERLADWEAGSVLFPSVRIDETTIVDLLPGEPQGNNMDHLCFVVGPDTDLKALVDAGDFDVESGPMEVWGAQGIGSSVYVRDPDGHRIELRVYPG